MNWLKKAIQVVTTVVHVVNTVVEAVTGHTVQEHVPNWFGVGDSGSSVSESSEGSGEVIQYQNHLLHKLQGTTLAMTMRI
jgi:hypothetical protein